MPAKKKSTTKAKAAVKPARAAAKAPVARVASAPEPAVTSAAASVTPVLDRTTRRSVTGVVISDKMEKTISVEVERFVRHAQFGKFLKKYTTCKAHDEKNEAQTGDLVEIVETRPLSATKRWRLVRIVRKSAVPAALETPSTT